MARASGGDCPLYEGRQGAIATPSEKACSAEPDRPSLPPPEQPADSARHGIGPVTRHVVPTSLHEHDLSGRTLRDELLLRCKPAVPVGLAALIGDERQDRHVS